MLRGPKSVECVQQQRPSVRHSTIQRAALRVELPKCPRAASTSQAWDGEYEMVG